MTWRQGFGSKLSCPDCRFLWQAWGKLGSWQGKLLRAWSCGRFPRPPGREGALWWHEGMTTRIGNIPEAYEQIIQSRNLIKIKSAFFAKETRHTKLPCRTWICVCGVWILFSRLWDPKVWHSQLGSRGQSRSWRGFALTRAPLMESPWWCTVSVAKTHPRKAHLPESLWVFQPCKVLFLYPTVFPCIALDFSGSFCDC